MQEQFSVVGKSKPKVDALAKVTGQALYTGDLKFPNMLYGKILASPYAHARILNIDTSKAEKLPGVKAVITHKDVPDLEYGLSPARWDERIFCIDKALYVGDKIAAVAAVDEETCHEACSLIKVEYEELPAVYDPRDALKEDAPQIHYKYPGNVNASIHQHFGDVDKAFQEAYIVRTDQFVGQRANPGMLEPMCAISHWEHGRLTLTGTSQSPYLNQYYLARQFGLKMGDVRCWTPTLGGGFGGKHDVPGIDFISAALAKITGRPVKMFTDRYEMFLYTRGRHKNFLEFTTGVSKEGKILGIHANFIMDGGAYVGLGIATAYYTGAFTVLPFDVDNFKFDMIRVTTNLPPCGPTRGHGAPQPRWALASQLDMIANELGMDPSELRKKNARQAYTETANYLSVTTCELEACIDKVKDLSGWEEKRKRQQREEGYGVGLAISGFVTGAGYPIVRSAMPHSAAAIRVDEYGTSVTLFTGAVDLGQGSSTAMAQIAAEAMGVPYEMFRVVAQDTWLAPRDIGAYASRQTLMSGWACKKAGDEIKEKVLALASEMMGVPVDNLDCKLGVIFEIENPENTLTFTEVAEQYFTRIGPLQGGGSYDPPKLGGKHRGSTVGTSPCYSWTAQVCEVQVDKETGQVNVLNLYDCHDSGTVINPMMFHAQVHGALSMGVGEILLEEIKFDNKGRCLTANLSDYRLPTAMDMPIVHSDTVDSYDPAGPYGLKEVGEGATVGALPAVGNSVGAATGVYVKQLPITAERLWRALEEQKAAKQQSEKEIAAGKSP